MSYHFCLRLIAWWKSIKKLATLTGSKDFTIPAEPEGIDGICVALELSHHQSMANVPQEDSAISGPWCQKLPIGGKSEWMDGTLEDDIKILDSQMFKQHLLFLAVLHHYMNNYAHFNIMWLKWHFLNDVCWTLTLWPVKMRTQFPLRTSHTRMVRSDDPVAT